MRYPTVDMKRPGERRALFRCGSAGDVFGLTEMGDAGTKLIVSEAGFGQKNRFSEISR